MEAKLASGERVVFFEAEGKVYRVRRTDKSDLWRLSSLPRCLVGKAVDTEKAGVRAAHDGLPQYEVLKP